MIHLSAAHALGLYWPSAFVVTDRIRAFDLDQIQGVTHELALKIDLFFAVERRFARLSFTPKQWRRRRPTRNLVMMTRHIALYAVTLLSVVAMQSSSANALSMHECSAKYKEAKAAGTLNGMKWNDFRRAQCGADATAAPPTAAAPATAPSPEPRLSPGRVGNAIFPRAVDPRYSDRSAGKARMETCLDQYKANKANNANGGLKWIQRGGGYYSECVKRLKSQA